MLFWSNMETLNAEYIEAQYRLWKKNPEALSSDWRFFFKGFELGGKDDRQSVAVCDEDRMRLQSRVDALVHRYRDLGHLLACTDPLSACPVEHPLLSLESLQLSPDDLDQQILTPFSSSATLSLRELIDQLKQIYCRSIGVEYMHIQNPEERAWLETRMEPTGNRSEPDSKTRRQILHALIKSTQFEQFLNKAYVGVTRFSLEGGDGLIPALDALTEALAASGCREIILGMAHRGRLNVLAHILKKPYEEIFSEFESCYDPDSLVGSGDVKYHTGYLTDIEVDGRFPMRIYLVHNPSHLESVDPVVEGIARSRQDALAESAEQKVVPVLIHGDAAFAGQGIVTEVLNLSCLKGYQTGGTIHIVINNQIGYTTLPEDARSTRYATDCAKMLMVPIFHVHGEDPEAVVHVMRLAAAYRMAFAKDVVVDMICYRRYGHNEGDEPYFTQPQMYERIRQRQPLSKLYAGRLIDEGVVTMPEIEAMEKNVREKLDADFQRIHGSQCLFPLARFYEVWKDYDGRYVHDTVKTGVDIERIKSLCRSLAAIPEGFNAHPKIQALLNKRLKAVETGQGIDWANAESLAFATLLYEGTPIRLSGQDVRRGTFSQRHAFLVDIQTGEYHVPLNSLGGSQAAFSAWDSLLAEAGVLGFEYGFSLVQPQQLVLWEAQFGDFINNAQSVIDLYLASAESKWQRLSGLVLLLPHGLEGQGPEHSSARPERFLQLCADENMQVCYPTTPAQYFHLLRRQMNRRVRKPLVVLTPKSLLRNPLALSRTEELTNGGFQEVLDDPEKSESVQNVIFCSGKIYYELIQKRDALKKPDVAIVRIEQYYPFPEERLRQVVLRYSQAKTWKWVQEEPENMGAWWFVRPLLEGILPLPLIYVGRKPSPSPATGFPKIYRKDQDAILDHAFIGLPALKR
ncbi:MAG: 2-oxoglutarate dehydrogenase E1 component [Deltaproteobacteria bacterium]|nr:2-oxoglutarate dehydrogenase E1 component [Deltaproteobacteria bacterium]